MQSCHQRNRAPFPAALRPPLPTRGALAAAALATALTALPLPGWSQGSSTAQVGGGSVSGSTQTVPPPPVTSGEADLPSVIVVPRDHRHDDKLANGCWVRFYNDKSYAGRSLTLVGPVQMPKIHVPGGLWVKWSSAIVGPGATVTTYDFEQFKNATAVLRPGQRIPDLRDRKLGLFEDIHSLRMACKR